jgi:hypothetical protein
LVSPSGDCERRFAIKKFSRTDDLGAESPAVEKAAS